MYQYYLSLGSNIENEYRNITNALTYLRNIKSTKLKISNYYLTAARDYEKQRDFLNVCVLMDSELDPIALLKELKRIEAKMGRKQTIRFGPRVIDLDIIWVKGVKYLSSQLKIPHERAHERRFVLEPLRELVEGDKELSVFIEENMKNVGEQRVNKISEFELKKQ